MGCNQYARSILVWLLGHQEKTKFYSMIVYNVAVNEKVELGVLNLYGKVENGEMVVVS